jgi:hypothetical protein
LRFEILTVEKRRRRRRRRRKRSEVVVKMRIEVGLFESMGLLDLFEETKEQASLEEVLVFQ